MCSGCLKIEYIEVCSDLNCLEGIPILTLLNVENIEHEKFNFVVLSSYCQCITIMDYRVYADILDSK